MNLHSLSGVAFFVLSALALSFSGIPSIPTVTIQNGTIIGSSDGNVDTFNGIPYAQPPVGFLRLTRPQPIIQPFGVLQATATPKSCPQFSVQIDPNDIANLQNNDQMGKLLNSFVGRQLTNAGENCLTVNVQRPANTNPNSKLPVLFWIFGGGFEFGSTAMYNATNLINKSIQLGNPIMYVSVNYRLSGFGFMPGKELAAEGNTNLGLRDQRLALQWVQENIAAFGGDPDRVTIWGESAGSISVFNQNIINGGDNTNNGKPLFRAAIMDSGTISPADPVTAPQAQAIFDTVAENAGCSLVQSKLACLRALDETTFTNAVNSVPSIGSFRSIDLSYSPRPDPGDAFFPISPDLAVRQGRIARVPQIVGDQEDEGTLFAMQQTNITTTDQVVRYLQSFFPGNQNPALVEQLVSLFPDDPAQGSPFNTGNQFNFYPQFKRLAAILGDITFTQTRRVYLDKMATMVPAWSYLSSYFRGTPFLGTFHATDVLVAYGMIDENSIPTQTMQTYYISFVNRLDPNALSQAPPLINWPQYDVNNPQLVNFLADSNALLPDTFRLPVSNFLANDAMQVLRI